jgi:hypothetical protein
VHSCESVDGPASPKFPETRRPSVVGSYSLIHSCSDAVPQAGTNILGVTETCLAVSGVVLFSRARLHPRKSRGLAIAPDSQNSITAQPTFGLQRQCPDWSRESACDRLPCRFVRLPLLGESSALWYMQNNKRSFTSGRWRALLHCTPQIFPRL